MNKRTSRRAIWYLVGVLYTSTISAETISAETESAETKWSFFDTCCLLHSSTYIYYSFIKKDEYKAAYYPLMAPGVATIFWSLFTFTRKIKKYVEKAKKKDQLSIPLNKQ